MRTIGLAALAAFIGTIVLANWLVTTYGLIDVGFGYQAPAAVLAVGLALTLRDIAHRALGRWPVIAAIIAGALLSVLVSPAFALASGTAFLVSELADLGVYEPLTRRSWLGAVVLSNTVGLVVDSVLFLWLAPGLGLDLLPGQILGKLYMTGLAVLLIAGSRAFLPRHAHA